MKFQENECRYIFCYGSLRPDDDSGMPWTKEAVAGMTAQPANISGAKLYRDRYAAFVFDDENEKNIDNKVIGWVLTAESPVTFRKKLEIFDEIEQYKEDGTGFYQRAIVDVSLNDPGRTIGGAEPIGSSGSVVKRTSITGQSAARKNGSFLEIGLSVKPLHYEASFQFVTALSLCFAVQRFS